MLYKLSLPNRPFEAIKNGTKKVEGRTITKDDQTPYTSLHAGDIIQFKNENTGKLMKTQVLFVHHYKSVRDMLEKEGPENVLSSFPKTIDHGIEIVCIKTKEFLPIYIIPNNSSAIL